MPPRPGDSAPKFDQIEANLAAADNVQPPPPPADDDGLPESHVFRMPVAIPHFSDGTTEILKRGRDHDIAEPQDPTEPLFPQPVVEAPVVAAAVVEEPVKAEPVDEEPASPPVTTPSPLMDLEATMPIGLSAPPPAKEHPAIAVAPIAKPSRTSSKPATQPAAAASTTPREAAAAPRPANGLLTILLISYASAVTLGLIYLLLNRGDAVDHDQLESLRDPVDEEGTVRIYQRGVELPPGHDLKLAQAQRFGNIRVEPLRVTRGPMTFQHYSGNAKTKQPPSPPVLKLWLKLTNVSDDQEIAPLDALLMFKRELNQQGDLVSNTYVAPRGQAAAGPVVFSYPVAQSSEWDIVGQSLGRTLAPGESVETFIPSDAEGLDALNGDVEWRFHLRKGYAPTKRGVTTLVQVHFHASQVETEPPPPAEPAAPGKKKA